MKRILQRATPLAFASSIAFGVSLASPANAEVRIGFLAPTTGIFAQVGKDMVDGFQMYLDEHKNKLGGADVTFIVEDTVGKPDTAVIKARKLILQDKVHMIVGGLLASTDGYIRIPYATEQGIFKSVSGNFFRRTGKSSQTTAKPLNCDPTPCA